ncbi:piggyBac transposable element-derived protein 3-like [Ornithodoros turicata]|uniref:piggyBac transposable element-derived protein 3-like n=1 Tax=Ornithodoros turicata TaxID=34597 RepID=UPI003139A27A
MVPFHWKVKMRQYVRGKPNPVGLKNFVLATPDGIPLDFTMYAGKGCTIKGAVVCEDLDIGGKVVLKLCESLQAGTCIFTDRYFTSVALLDELLQHGISGCGTLMRSRVPAANKLRSESQLKQGGRGASEQVARGDGAVSLVQWYDSRQVLVASTMFGKEPVTTCRRWCKKTKQYITVERPDALTKYNAFMGGVDQLDRCISMYRSRSRTNTWTVRMVFHMFDLACAAAWVRYRRSMQSKGKNPKEILDYLDFRMRVAEGLIYVQDIVETSDSSTDENTPGSRKPFLPLHPPKMRSCGALHMPEMGTTQKARSRCRLPGCKALTAVRCKECKIFLCFNGSRNCYKGFHTQK